MSDESTTSTLSHNNGPVRRITTHEAVIKTAAISVKVMTINNRQVTMGVFRQLQKEPYCELAALSTNYSSPFD